MFWSSEEVKTNSILTIKMMDDFTEDVSFKLGKTSYGFSLLEVVEVEVKGEGHGWGHRTNKGKRTWGMGIENSIPLDLLTAMAHEEGEWCETHYQNVLKLDQRKPVDKLLYYKENGKSLKGLEHVSK